MSTSRHKQTQWDKHCVKCEREYVFLIANFHGNIFVMLLWIATIAEHLLLVRLLALFICVSALVGAFDCFYECSIHIWPWPNCAWWMRKLGILPKVIYRLLVCRLSMCMSFGGGEALVQTANVHKWLKMKQTKDCHFLMHKQTHNHTFFFRSLCRALGKIEANIQTDKPEN